MARTTKRWQIWKIAIATVACAACGCTLLWLSTLAENVGFERSGADAPAAILTFPGIILMLALAAFALSILAGIWLILRIREARTPVWERGRRRKRF